LLGSAVQVPVEAAALRSRRRAGWMPWLLVLPVAVLHLALAALWPQDHFGLGEGADATRAPVPIEVSFVRELQPAAPPARPQPRTRVLRAAALRGAASAAASAADTGPLLLQAAPAQVLAEMPAPLQEVPPLAEPIASLVPPPPAAAASASAPAFEWPPSTRLTYTLTGNYNGPVEGQARVEWRLAGQRYQVALEVGIGPFFAPIVTRQLLSDGLVTADGLEPRRYDEETHIALRAPRRLSIVFDADRVVLPSGRQVPRPPGVQDSASQFVQMTWLFTTQPERLRAGTTIEFPLALPRQVQLWTYDVVGQARLDTPMGAIETLHVRPRRNLRGAGGDLSAEFWVAPTLQNLPVRIVIRQDEQTYVDLQLQRLPQQAEPAAPATSAASSAASAPAARAPLPAAPLTTR
jgi:hypothetical protein